MITILSNIIIENHQICPCLLICEEGVVKNCILVPTEAEVTSYGIVHNLIDSIVIPCFFNIHCHLGESLYEISDKEMAKMKISGYIAHTEQINKRMTHEERDRLWMKSADVTMKGQIENNICGICAARCADVCKSYEFKCMTGYPIMNSVKLNAYSKYRERQFIEYLHKHKSNMCSVGLFLHSLYATERQDLRFARWAMRNGSEFVTVHISEDLETRLREVHRYGKSPIDVLEDYDLLNDRTLIVHGGFLSEGDLNKVSKAKATIVVCPLSNITLNTNMPDIYLLDSMGINWCLATDGKTTGRTFSMIEQVKSLLDYFPMTSITDIYDSITKRPGSLFRRKIYTGSIENGVESKFIIVRKKETAEKSIVHFLRTGEMTQLFI